MEFSRQEYWSAISSFKGFSPTQGLNPSLLCLLHWQANFFTTSITWVEFHFEKM